MIKGKRKFRGTQRCVFLFRESLSETPTKNFLEQRMGSISNDLDLEPREVQQLMLDKYAWRKFVTAASNIKGIL